MSLGGLLWGWCVSSSCSTFGWLTTASLTVSTSQFWGLSIFNCAHAVSAQPCGTAVEAGNGPLLEDAVEPKNLMGEGCLPSARARREPGRGASEAPFSDLRNLSQVPVRQASHSNTQFFPPRADNLSLEMSCSCLPPEGETAMKSKIRIKRPSKGL